jgi:hypothetical protein
LPHETVTVELTNGGHQIREVTEFDHETGIHRGNPERYHSARRAEKEKILDEFAQVTGFHRKHAIRALRRSADENTAKPDRLRICDEAVMQALTILWEAADRICGKRLKQAIPTLVEAMERHGQLALHTDVRERVLKASAATIDRLLAPRAGRGSSWPASILDQHAAAEEYPGPHIRRLE